MTLEIAQLSDCPEHLRMVGRWIYDEWWSRTHDSPEVVFALLRTHDVRDRVPLTVVALIDGTPVGSCAGQCAVGATITPETNDVFFCVNDANPEAGQSCRFVCFGG